MRGGLTATQAAAVGELLGLVRGEVPARLEHALLFGSRARGDHRPDSDLDLLLIFRRLPPDREPHASIAEALAGRLAERSGVPLSAWCVARVDLEAGRRTPMLVDALADAVPLWPAGAPVPRVRFTPPDALFCASALLQRVAEGGAEVATLLRHRQRALAARRVRDDLARLCTANLLLDGTTRPRLAGALGAFVQHGHARVLPPGALPLLRWAALSYGPRGKDEERLPPPPPGGLRGAIGLVRRLQARTARRTAHFAERLRG